METIDCNKPGAKKTEDKPFFATDAGGQ